MANDAEEIEYKVWASDNMVYGPVNLDILLDWVADGRVTPDTWVFAEGINSWKPAKTLPALGEALAKYHASTAPLPTAVELGQAEGAITVEDLRQFDALAKFGQEELEQFIRHCSIMEIEEGGIVMKKDSPGDGLYMVLSGGTRVRIIAGGQDTTLADVMAGSFIGEVAMFSQTPRSADVIALSHSTLLFMSHEQFRSMIKTEPLLASEFLFALGRVMAERMVTGNQRLQAKASSEFLWL